MVHVLSHNKKWPAFLFKLKKKMSKYTRCFTYSHACKRVLRRITFIASSNILTSEFISEIFWSWMRIRGFSSSCQIKMKPLYTKIHFFLIFMKLSHSTEVCMSTLFLTGKEKLKTKDIRQVNFYVSISEWSLNCGIQNYQLNTRTSEMAIIRSSNHIKKNKGNDLWFTPPPNWTFKHEKQKINSERILSMGFTLETPFWFNERVLYYLKWKLFERRI